jgi:hypothetical protein
MAEGRTTSVGSILGGAFGLVRRQPLSVLVWGLLHLAAMSLIFLAMRPFFEVWSEMVGQQLAAPGKPIDPQMLQPFVMRLQAAGGLMFLTEIGVFALQIVLFTATQRAVLRPTERGLFYLRIGMDELRLVGLGFFLAIAAYIAMFMVMLVVGIVVAVAAVASGSPAVAVLLVAIAFLGVFGAMIYAMVRLSLAFPLTFLRRQFVVGEAWRLSGNRFWTLFGAYLVIAVIQQLLSLVLMSFAAAPFFAELRQTGSSPEAVRLALQHAAARFTQPDATLFALAAAFALIAGLTLALFGGAMATAARDLAGDPAGDGAAFA